MPEFVLTVARFGFLILLWIFVFTVVGVIRRDLFAGVRSKSIVASPRGVGGAVLQGRPAKAKRGKAARQLVVTAGQLAGTRITLGDNQITIGRGDQANLRLPDVGISRRHARLDYDGNQVVLTDLGSTNGTMVNGQRVSAVALNPGDMIQLGTTTLTFRVDG